MRCLDAVVPASLLDKARLCVYCLLKYLSPFAHMVQHRSLPAGDESGLSDPTVLASTGNQSESGKVMWKQTVSTLLEDLIEVRDITSRDGEGKPNGNVLMYGCDEGDKPMSTGRGNHFFCGPGCCGTHIEVPLAVLCVLHEPWVIIDEIFADFQLIPHELAIANAMLPLASPTFLESTPRISLVDL